MSTDQGRVVIVTGAGRGLGRAYAVHLATAGLAVVVNDIDADLAAAVTSDILAAGGRAVADAHSVSEWDGAASLVQSALDRFGSLDALVNNAGVMHLALPPEEEEEPVRRAVEVNVLGAIHCGVHASRVLVEAGRGGCILNVTSGYQSGVPAAAVYTATKGAIASLTYCWALDLAPHGIRVNAVSPIARTRMTDYALDRARAAGLVAGSPGQQGPDDVAPVVTYLLSDAADGISGQVVRFDGRHLSLVGHPATRQPVLEAPVWTVQDIERAFDETLRDHLVPVGLVETPT